MLEISGQELKMPTTKILKAVMEKVNNMLEQVGAVGRNTETPKNKHTAEVGLAVGFLQISFIG